MFHNTKNIFLFILVAFVAHSCDDTEETAQDGHTDADGMEIVEMIDGEEGLLYSECNGVIDNNFQSGIPSGNEWDLTVHFLDDECEELEHDDDDHDGHDHGDDDHDDHGDDEAYLEITGYDTSIISITVGGHDDHNDHDEEHGYTFELETLAPGETTFQVKLMHQGHSDYTSSTITIVVE